MSKLGSWGIPKHLSDLCGELAGWAKQTAIETGEPIEETAEDRGAQTIKKLALALMHYADEENWSVCEETGWDMMHGPVEGEHALPAAAIAQQALAEPAE
jgi:hypothetical protein